MRRYVLVALGLAASIAALYSPVVFSGETFVLRDALRFALPSRAVLSAAFAAGRLPEWFDGIGFGVAFAANPVHGVTSPLSWLLALSAAPWAFDALTLVQLLILSCGAAALASRLGATLSGAAFSGVVLVTSGFVVSAIPNGAIPYVTWIPWLALAGLRCAEGSLGPRVRRWTGAALAAALALQLLSGEPGFVLVAALLTLTLVLVAAPPLASLRRLVLPAAGGLGLACAGLVPAFILLGQSARAHGSPAGPLRWSMPPARIVEFVWPLAFGSEGHESWFIGKALGIPDADPCYALSLFLGAPVLALALAASRERRLRRLLASSLGFILLALGSSTPLYGALRVLAPPLRWINFPEKFVFGALLIWVVAAGVGFSRVFRSGLRSSWLAPASLVSAALLAAGAVAAPRLEQDPRALAAWLGPGGAGLNVGEGLAFSAAGAALAAAGAALFALALVLARRQVSPPLVTSLALVSVLAPLVFAARAITPLTPRALLAQTPRLLAPVPRGTGVRPRLFVDPQPPPRPALETGEQIASATLESLDTNVASLFGMDVVPGFETGDTARSHAFWNETLLRMSFPAFTTLAGVDAALVPTPERVAPGLPVLSRRAGWGIVATRVQRPRAFVAPRASVAGSADEGLAMLAAPGRDGDPARIAISGAGAEALESGGPLRPCAVNSPRPEEVVLDCASEDGGYAVLLDEHVKGWSADVDGNVATILTADGLFRAVRVRSGAHRVAFRYRTPGLRAGALVSLLTLLAVVISAVRPTGRSGNSPAPRTGT